MRKVLFATTAAAALALAGGAQAQVELGLGGYWEEWVGFADQDLDVGDWDQQSDKEIHVKGSTTLDNGVTVGVRFELEAQDVDVGNKHDEALLTMSGGFGSVILGNEDNVGQLLHVAAPDVGVGLQDGDVVVGKWVLDSVTTNSAPNATAIYDIDDTNKVSYTSVNFAGLVVGASLIPDMGAGRQGVQAMPPDANDSAYAVAAQYANEFDDMSVKLSAGYLFADSDDIEALNLGAQGGFGGFVVGASYYDASGADVGRLSNVGAEGDAWEIAGSYGEGPWAASVGYYTSETDAGPAEREIFQGSFRWTLGPGVDWKSSLARAEFIDDAGNENDGWTAITGFALGF